MQPDWNLARAGTVRRPKGPALVLVAVAALIWLVGAATIRRVQIGQIDEFGLEQSPPGLQGDPIWLVPAILTIPFAMVVAWALQRSHSRWPMAIGATIPAAAMAAFVAVFILTLRFAGDRSPVGTFEIEFAWFLYGCTAAIHALVVGVAAWCFSRVSGE